MKEDFAYSKRMHEENTLMPARRKDRRELATTLAVVAMLIGVGLDSDLANWLLDHAALLLLVSIAAWGMYQMGQKQRSRRES